MDAKKAIFEVVKAEDILNRLPLKRILGICAEVLTEDEIEAIFSHKAQEKDDTSFPAPIIIPMDEEQESELITLIREHNDANVGDSHPAPEPEPEPAVEVPKAEEPVVKTKKSYDCRSREDLMKQILTYRGQFTIYDLMEGKICEGAAIKRAKADGLLKELIEKGAIKAAQPNRRGPVYYQVLVPRKVEQPQEPTQKPVEPKKEPEAVPQVPSTDSKPSTVKLRPTPPVITAQVLVKDPEMMNELYKEFYRRMQAGREMGRWDLKEFFLDNFSEKLKGYDLGTNNVILMNAAWDLCGLLADVQPYFPRGYGALIVQTKNNTFKAAHSTMKQFAKAKGWNAKN